MTVGKRTIPIHFNASTTVSDIKQFIYANDGIPCELQRFLYNGRSLHDVSTLWDSNIRNDSFFYVLLRLRGGGGAYNFFHKIINAQGTKVALLKFNPQKMTIKDVKTSIFMATDIKEENQILFYNGRRLKDDKLLSHYKVEKLEPITLINIDDIPADNPPTKKHMINSVKKAKDKSPEKDDSNISDAKKKK